MTRIGIALSGGGARGIAHIGVLQALEEAGIYPQAVSGASAGAMVGLLYAAGHRPDEILLAFKSTPLFRVLRLSLPVKGLMDTSPLGEALNEYCPERLEDLAKPLTVSVTNFSRGCLELVSSGPAVPWVLASLAIPLLFKPQAIGGDLYGDGGLLNNLPIEPLESSCDLVIGVNVNPVRPLAELDGLKRLADRTLDLVMWANVQPRLERCDVAIEPETSCFGLFEVGRIEEIFQAGYEAAQSVIPQITAVKS